VIQELSGPDLPRQPPSLERPLDHVTPYDRFAWSDVDIEHLLASGEHREELTAYFGAQEYRELARLAQRAARTRVEPGRPHVMLIPGIMGSQLGLARTAPLPNDILWLDPIDIQLGRLAALRLPSTAPIIPLGIVLFSYLKLKLHLRAAGFVTTCHDYDWRLSLEELGRALAERLQAQASQRLAIVAHSMGGLVSRAALGLKRLKHVERLILLGTPSAGSFAPVQALRGTYAVVRKVARLAIAASAESLAEEVFSTFPSLYHMLPRERCGTQVDLFDPAQWPTSGPQPKRDLLREARAAEQMLAAPDERVVAVVGVGQETVTDIARCGDDFVYTVTRRGDGTVPAVSAEVPGASSYYVSLSHSDLTRGESVARAVVDLLRKGTTRRLATSWPRSSLAMAQVSDQELRNTHVGKVDWARMEPQERHAFLQNLNEPPELGLRSPVELSLRRWLR
jgi:pimeloyl-ACP methyl ester carboxylesterase